MSAARPAAAAVVLLLALAPLLLPAPARCQAPLAKRAAVPDPADAAGLAARAAFNDNDTGRIAAQAPALAGTLLEPYLEYWLAAARLHAEVPDSSRVAPFLARYNGSALADRLRADWLMVLAAQGDWAGFDSERRRLVFGGDDAQLACYTLLARYALDDGRRREALVREARRTLASISDPGGDGCTALAQRLLDDGQLPLWPRLQALVERSQLSAAAKLGARLAPADAAALQSLLRDPAAWLAAIEPHLDQLPHPLPLLAIVLLARDAPDRAAAYAGRLDATLSADERAMVWGRIGRMGALALAPDADAWFARGGDAVGQGSDAVRAAEVLEAQLRAALRRGATGAATGTAAAPGPDAAAPGPDWAAVRATYARMSPEQQADSAWIYWNARAAIALGQDEEGRAALASIAGRFSFYGRLAAEDLGLAPALPAPAEPAPAALVEELAQRPGFARAHKLYELGLRDEANREWNWELRGMDDPTLHAAAELARRYGVLDRMIASAERARGLIDIGQRYPMPYRDLMAATAAPLGLDPAWVYGLIRQESRFMEDIRSNAGAVGLMQLMPATARFVAHRIGLEHYRADRIGEVSVNLRLGAEYLKLVSDDQDGLPLLASAAYNSGPARVRRWRAALARPLDGAIFAETIPVGETRDYVKRVLFNTVVYAAQLDRPPQSLHALLAPVAPKPVPLNDLP